MLCGSLDGKGVWERMDMCICMVEFLPCSPETITKLLISYTPIQNVFFLFYFIFKLYIIVVVLPNIKMNLPQVYMCSPS